MERYLEPNGVRQIRREASLVDRAMGHDIGDS